MWHVTLIMEPLVRNFNCYVAAQCLVTLDFFMSFVSMIIFKVLTKKNWEAKDLSFAFVID